MKKISTLLIIALFQLFATTKAQMIFSQWPIPTNHIITSRNPDVLCTTLLCPFIYDAENIVDNISNNYATINFPLVSLGSSVSLTMDLNGTVSTGARGGVMIASATSLLSLSVLPNMTVELLNDNAVVGSQTYASLLDLSLLSSGGANLCVQPASPVYNKVRLTINIPLGVGAPLQFFIFGAYGNSTLQCSNGILPMQLKDFSVQAGHQCNANIKWITTDETRLSHFIIQRSEPGALWKDIKIIPAKNKGGEQAYFYEETMPAKELLYRLVSVDQDGKKNYYEGKMIRSVCNTDKLTVYPTLVKDFLFVSGAQTEERIEIGIFDMYGRKYPVHNYTSGSINKIDCSNLKPGIYIIHIKTPTKEFSEKICVAS
jgi:hypothetical protein